LDTPAATPAEPDTLAVVAHDGAHRRAQCRLWTRFAPRLGGRRLGVVGQFAAADAHAAVAVLHAACEQLRHEGCHVAVGPMDGNTWRRYRLVTWRSSEPPFFLEPDTPDDWQGYFAQAGFQDLAHYTSALNDDLAHTDPRVPAAWQRLQDQGVTLRTLDLDRFDEELAAIHRLTVVAFTDAFLYTPIDLESFRQMYRPIRGHVDPRLVLLAHSGGELVGYLFAIANLAQAQRGGVVDTAIIKTMAVAPGRQHAGLGSVLMDRAHQTARELGYRRVIHALMHEANASRRLSSRTASTIRRYALLARTLT
jgi:GNAT superfamily N-acetyltransferase